MGYAKDVFVSYHDADLEWVDRELLKRLRDGRISYVEPRDFKIGRISLDEFEHAISTSRRTLLIMSEGYLRDGFNDLTRGMALSFSLENRHWSVVPVLIQENLDLPLSLRTLVRVNLCAPSDEDWRNFIRALSLEPTVKEMTKPKQESPVDPHAAGNGLALLVELMGRSEIKAALGDYREAFEDLCLSMNLLDRFKALHLKFQAVEGSFNLFVNFARPDSTGVMAWEHLQVPALNLSEEFKDLISDACASPFAEDNDPWVLRLRRVLADLKDASEKMDYNKLRPAIQTVTQVFNTIPSRLNRRMVDEVKALGLNSLGRALMLVHGVLKGLEQTSATTNHLTRIENSASRIEEIDRGLRMMLYVHDSLQQIDDEVRRVEATLDDDISQIVWLWDAVKPKMRILSNDTSNDWSTDLAAAGAELETSLPGEASNLKNQFHRYRSQVTRSFNRVDSAMLNRCKELNEEVSKPLAPLLTLLQA